MANKSLPLEEIFKNAGMEPPEMLKAKAGTPTQPVGAPVVPTVQPTATTTEPKTTTLSSGKRALSLEQIFKNAGMEMPEEYKVKIQPPAAIKTAEVKPLDTLTVGDKVKDIIKNPGQLAPFYASGKEAVQLAKLASAAIKLKQDKASQEDLLLLKDYIDEASRDKSFGYKVLDVVSGIPSFVGEMALTMGIGKLVAGGVKEATELGVKKALQNLLTKEGRKLVMSKLAEKEAKAVAAETAALKLAKEAGESVLPVIGKKIARKAPQTLLETTIQAPFAGATRIAASAIEKTIPEYNITQNEKGELVGQITKEGDSAIKALTKAFGENWVEVVSERTGGLLGTMAPAFSKLTDPVKDTISKLAIVEAFRKANNAKPGWATALGAWLKKGGWNGTIPEMFEEQVGNVGHGILYSVGLGDQEFKTPTLEDLAVQLVAFSVPGVITNLGSAAYGKIEKDALSGQNIQPTTPTPATIAQPEALGAPQRGDGTTPSIISQTTESAPPTGNIDIEALASAAGNVGTVDELLDSEVGVRVFNNFLSSWIGKQDDATKALFVSGRELLPEEAERRGELMATVWADYASMANDIVDKKTVIPAAGAVPEIKTEPTKEQVETRTLPKKGTFKNLENALKEIRRPISKQEVQDIINNPEAKINKSDISFLNIVLKKAGNLNEDISSNLTASDIIRLRKVQSGVTGERPTFDALKRVVASQREVPADSVNFIKDFKERHKVDIPVYVVDFILDKRVPGEVIENWGVTYDKSIALTNKISEFTQQHEVAHYVFRYLLGSHPSFKDFNREDVLNEIRRADASFEKMSDYELEEVFAEKMEDYAAYMDGKGAEPTGITSKLKDLLKRFWEFIKGIFDIPAQAKNDLMSLYEAIYKGKTTGEVTTPKTLGTLRGKIKDVEHGKVIEFEKGKPAMKEIEKIPLSDVEKNFFDELGIKADYSFTEEEKDYFTELVKGRIFHGTNSPNNIIKNGLVVSGAWNGGVSFSTSIGNANMYRKMGRGKEDGTNIITVDPSKLKILDIDSNTMHEINQGSAGLSTFVEEAKRDGYDGIRDDAGEYLIWNVGKINDTIVPITDFFNEVLSKRPSFKKATPERSLIDEAKKYKTVEEFVGAQEAPKMVTVWNKSRFSNSGAYTERPVIRKVENKTLYQGGENSRQFWTPDKKYAEQFGDVKEKTGTFYQVDNGNRMTEVYVDATKAKSQLTDIWNKAQEELGPSFKKKDVSKEEEIVKAFGKVKSSLPILSRVLVKDGKISMTNLETAIQSETDMGDGVYKVIGTDMEKDTGFETSDFPVIPKELKSFGEVSRDDVLSLLSRASKYLEKGQLRPALSGVKIEIKDGNINAVATDGYRLFRDTAKIKNGKEVEFIVGTSKQEVERLVRLIKTVGENIKIGYNEEANMASFSDGKTTIFSKAVEERFPEYGVFLSGESLPAIQIDKDKIKEATKQLSPYLNKEKSIDIEKDGDTLILSAANPAKDISKSVSIPIKKSTITIEKDFSGAMLMPILREGAENRASVNYEYLDSILGSMDGDTVRMTSALGGREKIFFTSDKTKEKPTKAPAKKDSEPVKRTASAVRAITQKETKTEEPVKKEEQITKKIKEVVKKEEKKKKVVVPAERVREVVKEKVKKEKKTTPTAREIVSRETREKTATKISPTGIMKRLRLAKEGKQVTVSDRASLRRALRREAEASRKGMFAGREAARKNLMEKINKKNQDIEEIKTALIDYVKEVSPGRPKQRFLTAVKNTKTINGLLNQFAIADRESEKDRKRIETALLKKRLIKVAKSASIDEMVKEQIVLAASNLGIKGGRKKIIKSVLTSKQFLDKQAEDENASTFLADEFVKNIETLSLVPYETMTSEQLRAIRENIESLEQIGRYRLASRAELREAKKEYLTAKILESNVRRFEDYKLLVPKPGEKLTLKQNVVNFVRKARRQALRWYLGATPTDVVLDMLDNDAGYYGTIRRIFKVGVDNKFSQYLKQKGLIEAELLDKIDSLGLTPKDFASVGIYAAYKQKTGKEKLQGTLDASGYSEKEINDIFQKIESGTFLNSKQMELYVFMRQKLEEIKVLLQKMLLDVYNKRLDDVDDYFPFLTDFQLMSDIDIENWFGTDADLIASKEAELSKKGANNSKKIQMQYTKSRADATGKQKIKLNAVETFLSHMDNALYAINMSQEIRKLNDVLQDERIKEKLGPVGYDFINTYLNLLAKKGGVDGARTMPWLDKLRTNAGAAMLGLKLGTVLLQTTAFFDGASLIGKYAAYGANAITSPKVRKFLRDNFQELRTRGVDDPAYLQTAEGALGKLQELGYKPLKKIDNLTAAAITAGAYIKYHADNNLPLNWETPNPRAIRHAELMLARTQASALFKDLPQFISAAKLTGNRSFDKALLQFSTFMLNRFSLTRDMKRLYKNNQKSAALGILLWLTIANLAELELRDFVQHLTNLVTGKGWTDDDEEELTKVYLSQVVNNIPVASQLQSVFKYRSIPMPVAETAMTAAEALGGVFTSNEADAKMRNLRNVAFAIAKLSGITGSSQVEQLVKKLSDGDFDFGVESNQIEFDKINFNSPEYLNNVNLLNIDNQDTNFTEMK